MHFYYGVNDKVTFMFYSDKLGFIYIIRLSHRSEVSCKSLKSTKSCAMQTKVMHFFDSGLPNGLNS